MTTEFRDRVLTTRPRLASVALWGLFLIALAAALEAAVTLLLPVVLALFLSSLLRPPVSWLARRHVPRTLGAGLGIAVLVVLVVLGVQSLKRPALEWLETLPRTVDRLERTTRRFSGPVEDVNRAAKEVQKMTRVDETDGPTVEVEKPSLASTVVDRLPSILAGAVITLVLTFLLLVYGKVVSRKVVETLPGFAEKRTFVEVIRRIGRHLSRYLLTVTGINVCLGAAVGTALWLAGVPNPWLWGTMAGILNFVPYLGGFVGVSVVAVVAFVSIDDPTRAVVGPLLYATLNSLEGLVITPIVLGERFSLNPVMIFVWLFTWGWLWGIGGALIAVPLLTSFKIVCDAVPGLQGVGHVLER